jgi:site-specific recombinase XerD
MDSIKGLLGHKSVETTQIYIVKDDTDDEDEIFT